MCIKGCRSGIIHKSKKEREFMRRMEGTETWHRLLEWDLGQAASERLAGIILAHEGFRDIDPSHPLGGRDGLKDMVLTHKGRKWVAAVYFPRGQQSFSDIKKKFLHDCEGAAKNNAGGIAFITNQEIKLSERKELVDSQIVDVQLFHLERICLLLNMPSLYGARLDFLGIDMSKEEQLSFFAEHDSRISKIESTLSRLSFRIEEMLDGNVEDSNSTNKSVEDYRSINDILRAENEFMEKIWFDRHLSLRHRVAQGIEIVDPTIWDGAIASAKSIVEKYGEDDLGPYSDFEWGMLNGKLSALRWVLGDEWDMLDT